MKIPPADRKPEDDGDGMTTMIAGYDDADARNDPHFTDFERARDLLLGSDWREGLEQLEALAHGGSTTSLLLVAGCILEGWGYEQDFRAAEAWYKVAADRGSARGNYGLGLARIRMGRCKDAIDPLEHAISQDYPPAYSALAYVYSRGVDVPPDRRRALGLWQTGASLGHLDSARDLVWALLHGYAGFRGRLEGLWKMVPMARQLVSAREEPIMPGSGDFHRVR